MRKNILIAALAAMAVFAFLFARIKAEEAEIQKLEALENQVFALENREKANAQAQKTEEVAAQLAIFEQQVDELERALEVCQ